MGFEPAKSHKDAEWVEEALRRGHWGRVSGVVPSDFEACAAVRHPAWRCVCTADNLRDFQAGRGQSVPIRWSEVAVATAPVIYGGASRRVFRVSFSRPTQYRRLGNDGWIVDEVSGDNGLTPLIRNGDVWIREPNKALHPDLALSLVRPLRAATTTPDSCWFGIWDGFLSDDEPGGASIAAPHRRWLLYRGAVEQLTDSIDPRFEFQSANLVWPEDRSWCLATDIDAECTCIAGSRELITAIRDEPSLEVQTVCPEDRLPRLGDVLAPVVERPPNLKLPTAFEAREYQYAFSQDHVFKLLKRGPRMRALRMWLRAITSIHIAKRKDKD